MDEKPNPDKQLLDALIEFAIFMPLTIWLFSLHIPFWIACVIGGSIYFAWGAGKAILDRRKGRAERDSSKDLA